MDKEKIIVGYMQSLHIPREEAEQLYLDDMNDYIGEEGEKYQEAAKSAGQHREKSDKPRTKSTRERKIDTTKAELMQAFKTCLLDKQIEITAEKTETELSFSYGGDTYTLKLTKHRKK